MVQQCGLPVELEARRYCRQPGGQFGLYPLKQRATLYSTVTVLARLRG